MSQEQRKHPRFSLDPNTGTLTSPEGYRHLCRIMNISASGVMLELSLLDEVTDLKIGDFLSIETPPDDMEDVLEGVQGEVMWIRGESLGIRFTRELNLAGDMLHPMED